MKRIILLFSLVAFFSTVSQAQCCKNASTTKCKSASASGCGSSGSALAQNIEQTNVEAYYFHFSRRCETCKAVEEVSADIIKELYGDKIVLKSINLDDKANEALAKRLGVDGQSLLFVKGTTKKDIVNDGFMYAKTNPTKLKEKIKSTVESLK